MHYVTSVAYECDYRLLVTFDDEMCKRVNLVRHLDGEIFEPLRDIDMFRTARLNSDIDTVVWDNGADMSPDFLYEIGEPIALETVRKVAESETEYRV